MRVTTLVAAAACSLLLMGTVVVGPALPAAALDEGALLAGDVHWFNRPGPLGEQSATTQITSGSDAVAGGATGDGRPWVTLTTDAACPAGTTQMHTSLRIPEADLPEDDWSQVPLGEPATLQDATGAFYTTDVEQAGRLDAPDVMAYLAAHAGQGTFPLVVVCRDEAGRSTGYFRTELAMTGSTPSNLAWSIASPPLPISRVISTTTLTASTRSEGDGAVDLSVTVSPSDAAGVVELVDGATSLGTATITSGVASFSLALEPGTHMVRALYLGSPVHEASSSSPVAVEGPDPGPTTTVVETTPRDGLPYQEVTVTTTVSAARGTPTGTVTLRAGDVLLVADLPVLDGVASFTTSALGDGTHTLTADFVGASPYPGSSGATTMTLSGPVAAAPETVVATIPAGAITISTPYSPDSPLSLGTATLDAATATYSATAPFTDIVITDTRAGDLGFTASIVSGTFENGAHSFSGQHAGLTALTVHQVPGNALQAGDVVVTDHAPFTDGLDTPQVFASYAPGQPIGTAHVEGTFAIAGVPTSAAPGRYTATVTVTVV